MATALLNRWSAAARDMQRLFDSGDVGGLPAALDNLNAAYNALYDAGELTPAIQADLVRLQDAAFGVQASGAGVAVVNPFQGVFTANGLRLGTLVIPWVGVAAAALFGFVVWRTTRRSRRRRSA